MTADRPAWSGLRSNRGTTLIELLSALAVMTLVVGSLYLLLGASVRGRLIVHARVSDQERGRVALTWLADRVRQVSYDPQAACPDGLLRTGAGGRFEDRLAFRAIVDQRLDPPRRIYSFYVEDRTLWQETLVEAPGTPCLAELAREAPDPGRARVTPRIVERLALAYLDRHGAPAASAGAVRSIGIMLRLASESTPGRSESQTYQTVVTIRGP